MHSPSITLRTEVYGLTLHMDGASLQIATGGEPLIEPVPLSDDEVARLGMQFAKAQLWEWNQLQWLKYKAEKRSRRFLGAWLVLCVAAFSAYIGYPSYYPPLALTALSVFLWWRASYLEQKADRLAAQERGAFVPDWSYLQQRLEEVSEADPGV